MTGRGRLEFEEKRMIYEGDFVNGLMSGQRGKMQFSNGMTYEGEWLDDQFCGEGVLYLPPDGKNMIKGTWLECSLIEGTVLHESGGIPDLV
jgi:hypothetical protein